MHGVAALLGNMKSSIILHPCGCGHLLLYDTEVKGAIGARALRTSSIDTCCLCNTRGMSANGEPPPGPILKDLHPWAGCMLEEHYR